MSNVDYSKFDKMADELDKEEEREKMIHKMQVREKYEKERQEKITKWENDMRAQGKDVEKLKKQMQEHSCGHSHFGSSDGNHGHDHKHSHGDSHEHEEHRHNSSEEKEKGKGKENESPFARHSCGYMPVEEIKRLQKESESKPKISTADKNKKKIEAVYAAKMDGNRLFKEGNYKLAFQVYERGVLIINGMYDLSDDKYGEMENIECLLNLNMAFCKLKMGEWTEAIDCVNMSLQIDKDNAKAYYRMAEAYIGMGEYEKAKEENLKAQAKNDAKYDHNSEEYKKNVNAMTIQLGKIEALHKKQLLKQKKQEKQLAKNLKSKLKKSLLTKDSGTNEETKANAQVYSEENEIEIDDADT